jgi:restriction endonuclease Mrr
LEIRILGDNDQVRGKAFENLMVQVLDHLGYTDFKTNIRPAAMELDIEASHKNQNKRILCECKAHKDPIGPEDIKKFHSNLNYEIDKKYVDSGFFFSTSGFTANADRWYQDSGDRTKEIVSLNGTREIVDLLQNSSMLSNEEQLNHVMKKNTSYQL